MLKRRGRFTLVLMRASFLSIFVIITVATVHASQPFTEKQFEQFTGILPNGEFRFAVEVLEAVPASANFPGIPKGAFITNILFSGPDILFVTEGQPEMIELLVNLAPGSRVIIGFIEAKTGTASRVEFKYQYTEQQRAEIERIAALEEEERQKKLREYRENVHINGKCDRSRVVYCEWGMPDYGQLGDNVHICDGVQTTHGIFPGSNSKCNGVIGWCNPMTGKQVQCPE